MSKNDRRNHTNVDFFTIFQKIDEKTINWHPALCLVYKQ